jgi:polyisoprenoid-binding protein YceI
LEEVRRLRPAGRNVGYLEEGPLDFRLSRVVVAGLAAVALAGVFNGPALPSVVVAAQDAPAVTRLQVAPGTKAFYRVREQLVGISFPNDAVGSTDKVEGTLVVRSDGTIDATESRITVDLRTLSTDQERRDNYLRRNTLQTEEFPLAVFVPRRAVGLTWPPPIATPAPAGQARGAQPPAGQGRGAEGMAGQGRGTPPGGAQATGPRPGFPIGFQLVGDMTIRNVTKEVTWDVIVSFNGDAVQGKALTAFNFATFNLTRPQVSAVIGVEDDIRLELELRLTRSAG